MPRFSTTLNRYVQSEDVTVLASAARTATAQSAAVDVEARAVVLDLVVSVVSGTSPTLDVVIETRRDSSDTWRSLGAFAQKTTAVTERKGFAGVDRQVRANYTIAGTSPSFTFAVTGDAK